MSIDPVVLSSLTAAVSVLGNECLKGIASGASKDAWASIKRLFGWVSDPAPGEIPEKVAHGLTASPEIAGKLLELLKNNPTGAATGLVGRLEVSGGKVVVAGSVNQINM